MTTPKRLAVYYRDRAGLTPAQRRRYIKKINQQQRKQASAA